MVKVICEFCQKEFKGVNKAQVESQLAVHKVTKHKDKVRIVNKKGV